MCDAAVHERMCTDTCTAVCFYALDYGESERGNFSHSDADGWEAAAGRFDVSSKAGEQ